MAANEHEGVAAGLAAQIEETVGRAIVGQQRAVQEMLVAVLAGGHVLLEGVPGVAKTLMVRALAASLGREFARVQMTPDLMPSDIVGTYVYDASTTDFRLRRGPIFTQFLLADEINRAPAKTQSALLEGMQERQASIEGVTHPLPPEFTVFATQNPIEFEGTYPLPEAQLDRFMLKVVVEYPSEEEEDGLLRRYYAGFNPQDLAAAGIEPVATEAAIAESRREVASVRVEDEVISYISGITRATREHPAVLLGCSPRASVMLLQASRVLAALRGRDYLIPDDVKQMAPPTLRHRMVLLPEADIEGLGTDDVIAAILASVEVPR
ncbi:MAG: MoxR family ATPase [candidate division WS1 bacterium]|jgi:MoxR-like ATPase|nr:MoxR family ATPase [candidate division WS1 bacterium]